MKTFKKIEVNEIQAAQYGKDEEANKFVRTCVVYDGEVEAVPGDMLGIPKNSFKGVKTSTGWTKIEKGDWIVQKDNEILVVPNGVFKLMFVEV